MLVLILLLFYSQGDLGSLKGENIYIANLILINIRKRSETIEFGLKLDGTESLISILQGQTKRWKSPVCQEQQSGGGGRNYNPTFLNSSKRTRRAMSSVDLLLELPPISNKFYSNCFYFCCRYFFF